MQKQQPASYDLLAVFPDEAKAETASEKLKQAGFKEEEIYQLPTGIVGSGQFREHGPNQARGDIFLQTQRSGPNPAIIALFAVLCCLVVTGLTFAATFALPHLPEPTTLIVGAALGLVLGAILGLLQRGRVRGAIGQEAPKVPPPTSSRQAQGKLNVIALRFDDPDNISRNSRARAILLNNQGRIDRSVSRQE
ncbi:hypothetical protein [Dictyobacter formicarum]|uniref:DUF1269 domain-containing protein n=1 Tax=Dictyobacter formicarum TaxID=2778368 RepID=A0ABQ3VNF8_9CHLR|nr:hypothetical protein [Dictyobacter formicarum]GHO87782.1 hypothetical protein KSZ_57880 [Dictyobacter formicarum]